MVMLPWLCFTIGVCEMGLLLHSSCETPFFTKTFVETFSCFPVHTPGLHADTPPAQGKTFAAARQQRLTACAVFKTCTDCATERRFRCASELLSRHAADNTATLTPTQQ
jgi:hypothetical protein